jgi:hypothetical protein
MADSFAVFERPFNGTADKITITEMPHPIGP